MASNWKVLVLPNLSANVPPVNEPTVAPARSVLTTHPTQMLRCEKVSEGISWEQKEHGSHNLNLYREQRLEFYRPAWSHGAIINPTLAFNYFFKKCSSSILKWMAKAIQTWLTISLNLLSIPFVYMKETDFLTWWKKTNRKREREKTKKCKKKISSFLTIFCKYLIKQVTALALYHGVFSNPKILGEILKSTINNPAQPKQSVICNVDISQNMTFKRKTISWNQLNICTSITCNIKINLFITNQQNAE